MAAKRYKVMILEGAKRPEFVRNVGWFSSPADAESWCEQQGLGQTPIDGEWAVVPRRNDEVQMPPRGDA